MKWKTPGVPLGWPSSGSKGMLDNHLFSWSCVDSWRPLTRMHNWLLETRRHPYRCRVSDFTPRACPALHLQYTQSPMLSQMDSSLAWSHHRVCVQSPAARPHVWCYHFRLSDFLHQCSFAGDKMPLLNDVRVRSSEDKSMMSRSDGLRTGDMLTDLGYALFFFFSSTIHLFQLQPLGFWSLHHQSLGGWVGGKTPRTAKL